MKIKTYDITVKGTLKIIFDDDKVDSVEESNRLIDKYKTGSCGMDNGWFDIHSPKWGEVIEMKERVTIEKLCEVEQ